MLDILVDVGGEVDALAVLFCYVQRAAYGYFRDMLTKRRRSKTRDEVVQPARIRYLQGSRECSANR